MLEYDFNELDNDFITIWSKYILYPSGGMPYGLEELACLGQINAIQSIFLLDDNKIKTKNITQKVMDKIEYLENKNYDANFNEELIIQHAMCRKRNSDNIYLIYNGLIRDNLSNLDHLDIVLHKHLLAYYTSSNNPIILQRYYEIKKGNHKLVSKLTLKRLRAELRELYYKDTTNAANAFAYAKNLYFFGNKDEKHNGIYILNNLANREFSPQLQEVFDKKEEERKKQSHEETERLMKTFFGDLPKEKVKTREEEIGFIDALCEMRDKEMAAVPEQLSIFDIND